MLQFGRYFTKAEIADVLTDGNGNALNLNAAESIAYGSAYGQPENLKQFARAAFSFSDSSNNGAYLYCPFKATNDSRLNIIVNNSYAHAEMDIFIRRDIASIADSDIAGFIPKSGDYNVSDRTNLALGAVDDLTVPDFITDPNAPLQTYFIGLYIAGIAGGPEGSSNNTVNRDSYGTIALSIIFNTYGYTTNDRAMFANSFNEQTGVLFNHNESIYDYTSRTKSIAVATVAEMAENGFMWTPTIVDSNELITTMDQLAAIINGDTPEPPTPPVPTDLEERVEVLENQMKLLSRTYAQI